MGSSSYLCSWIYSRGLLSRWRNLSTILFFPTPCNYTESIKQKRNSSGGKTNQNNLLLIICPSLLLMQTKLVNIYNTSFMTVFFFNWLLNILALSSSYLKGNSKLFLAFCNLSFIFCSLILHWGINIRARILSISDWKNGSKGNQGRVKTKTFPIHSSELWFLVI